MPLCATTNARIMLKIGRSCVSHVTISSSVCAACNDGESSQSCFPPILLCMINYFFCSSVFGFVGCSTTLNCYWCIGILICQKMNLLQNAPIVARSVIAGHAYRTDKLMRFALHYISVVFFYILFYLFSSSAHYILINYIFPY